MYRLLLLSGREGLILGRGVDVLDKLIQATCTRALVTENNLQLHSSPAASHARHDVVMHCSKQSIMLPGTNPDSIIAVMTAWLCSQADDISIHPEEC